METRIVTEVKLYRLILTDIRMPKSNPKTVAISTDYKKLVNWYNSHKEDKRYRDDEYYKYFKKGSPLEYFAKPKSLELNKYESGIRYIWISTELLDLVIDTKLFIVID